MPSGPARAPLVAPSLLRMYGLRSATSSSLMILSLGASTFMLREAATGPVIGGQKGYAGDYGPAIEAWLDTPGGVVVASNGDVYIADSNNHVIRRDRRARRQHRAGRRQSRRRAADSPATTDRATMAQLDTPDGVAIAPGRRSRSSPTRTTIASAASTGRPASSRPIAGSGENGYDGDDKPATRGGAQHAERRRGGAERRHLHRRHAELPRPR